MAGAEGKRGLDLDGDAVWRHAGAIVRGMHYEPAGLDRPQALVARLDPVLRRRGLERDALGGVGTSRERDERAHRRFVRWIAKMDGNDPAVRPVLTRAHDCRLRIEALRSRIHYAARRGLVGREPCDRGGSLAIGRHEYPRSSPFLIHSGPAVVAQVIPLRSTLY